MIRFLAMLAVVLLSACRTVKEVYIPVENVKTEYKTVVQADSVHVRDSVYVLVKGDTIYKDRWHTEYRDRWRNDTILKADSIPVPYPVERKLSKWERVKIDYGGHALTVAFFAILIGFGSLVYKIKK